jgi:integrase
MGGTLRRISLSRLYEQGVSIEKIQDILGHSSPTITKLIYVEVTRHRPPTSSLTCSMPDVGVTHSGQGRSNDDRP